MIDPRELPGPRLGQRGIVFHPLSAKQWLRHLTLLLSVAAAGTLAASAQLTTADILGTVTDPTGAVIPGATVTLLNLGTHQTRTTTANASGNYDFSLLPVGTYSVTVTESGFKTSTSTNLSVEAGDRDRTDVSLQTGGSSETVTVEAQTPLLQADNATVSSTITAQAVQDLPLNGRNFVQLVQLVPGANEGPGNGLTSGGRPDDRRSTSSFSVNGQDDTLNNYTVDGLDDNERIIGTIGIKPNVSAINEITVETNSYSPEAGRTAGGVVTIITRSGTNKFHGSLFEYFRNDKFDARNVNQTTGRAPELRQNDFGGDIGGPIFKDRTFFFGDYEGFRQVNGVTDTSTVPTLAEYNNINSLNGGSPQALIAQGNGTAGLAVDPIALAYLKLFPAPNTGGPGQLTRNYVISPKRTQFSNSFDARIDHHFNDKNIFFGRYSYNKVNTFTPPNLGTVGGLQISGGRYNFDGPAIDTAQQYAFGFTHIFTDRLVADLRAGYTRINNQSLPLNYGSNAATTIGFPGNINYNSRSSFLPPVGFGPFSDIGDGAYVPIFDIDGTYQYLANISYTRGNHNIKFGASFIRRQARNVQSAFAAGQFGFGLPTDNLSAAQGGSPLVNQTNVLASSLAGAFRSESRNVDITPPDYRTYEPSAFVQDTWKVTPKLTLIYGVRYDLFTPFTEAHNRISNFDFFQALGDNASNINSALKIAKVKGVDGHAGIKTDYSNVAPRVGFAFSPTEKLVIRGGYGLSYFPSNYTSNTDLKNAPFTSVYSPNCQSSLAVLIEKKSKFGPVAGSAPDCATISGAITAFDQGLPLPTTPNVSNLAAIPALSFTATQTSNFRSARIQQFNLQVEQQFGANVFTIGYVGNTGQHLPEVINNINQPAPYNPGNQSASTGVGFNRLHAILPNLNGVGLVQTEGISNYNALQTSLQRRFSHGLAFDANYTWGKALGDVTGFSQEGDSQGYSNANPFQIGQIEYGVQENDIAHRAALSLNYALPFGHGFTGLKKLALGGYNFNTIAVWETGHPFTILNGGGNADGPFGNRAVPNGGGGRDRPNQIDNPHGNRSNAQFFNTAAFAPQPIGTVGNVQRNSLFGPHFRHVDVSVFKDFAITERTNLQFRVETFNITNTPSFIIGEGSGSAVLGNPNFGKVVDYDPNYRPRQIQFAAKVQF